MPSCPLVVVMYLCFGIAFLLLVANAAPHNGVPEDYVRVPGGKLFHKSCVHHVPNGSHLRVDKNKNTFVTLASGEVIVRPRCLYPVIKPGPLHGPAWKAWAEYNNTAPVTKLTTAWTVPPSPASYTGQILYYWNGIEPAQNTAVLQPVLQFGATPAGGGQYWGIASWYVDDSTAQYSDVQQCTINTVVGDMTVDSSGVWTVTGVCSPQKATLTYTPPDADYTWAYPCVLEAYDVDDCVGQYPSSNQLGFNNIKLWVGGKQMTPMWAPQTKNNKCNEHVVVQSTVQLTLFWNGH